MNGETFDQGDLYGLEVCLRDLDHMLSRAEEAKTDKAVAYALVKTFELTYELAIKTMCKYLIVKTHKSDKAESHDFQDLIRLADQSGLLQNGWPEWKQYRADQGRTVHTYSEAVSRAIAEHLQEFSTEIHVLLANLRRRLRKIMTETRQLELDLSSLQTVRDILKAHVPDRPVFAFGSRTRGRARRRSDLDLAVGGPTPLERRAITDLKEAFSESDLPIFVDVIDIGSIDAGFLQQIERDFVPFPLCEQLP